MFNRQQRIIDDLVCPRCQERLLDLRITSFYETICIRCVEELTTKNDVIINWFFLLRNTSNPKRNWSKIKQDFGPDFKQNNSKCIYR